MPTEELDAQVWKGLEYLESVSGPGAIVEVATGFIQDAPPRLARMKAALEVGDLQDLARLAHDLKANSAAIGALGLSVVAARIEQAAEDAARDNLADSVPAAQALLPGVLAALEERVKQYPG